MSGNDVARGGQLEGLMDVRDPLPAEVRDPSFPASVRGYDRRAVDTYVERVNRLIAELQVSGSPRAAVRHALDRVGEQTSGILQRARETAEEITTSAREEAEETTARAKAEAQDILDAAERGASTAIGHARAEADQMRTAAKAEADEILTRARDEAESTLARARSDAERRLRQAEEELGELHERAEARMHALQADIESVSEERRTLIAEVDRIATRLAEIVAEATPAAEEEQPQEELAEREPEPHAAVAGDGAAPAQEA